MWNGKQNCLMCLLITGSYYYVLPKSTAYHFIDSPKDVPLFLEQ